MSATGIPVRRGDPARPIVFDPARGLGGMFVQSNLHIARGLLRPRFMSGELAV